MELINVITTAFVGALSGLGAAFIKNRIDFLHEVRSELWNKRYDSYAKIWRLTQSIPRWPKNDKLTYGGLDEISRFFQDWYFRDGGMLLSESSREKYGDMQETFSKTGSKPEPDKMDSPLDNADYNSLLEACSSFRSALTNELLSRKTTK